MLLRCTFSDSLCKYHSMAANSFAFVFYLDEVPPSSPSCRQEISLQLSLYFSLFSVSAHCSLVLIPQLSQSRYLVQHPSL